VIAPLVALSSSQRAKICEISSKPPMDCDKENIKLLGSQRPGGGGALLSAVASYQWPQSYGGMDYDK